MDLDRPCPTCGQPEGEPCVDITVMPRLFGISPAMRELREDVMRAHAQMDTPHAARNLQKIDGSQS